MIIRTAKMDDFEVLLKYDKHIKEDILKRKIENSTVIVAYSEDSFLGWLRFNYFWDEIPFMNMLFVLDDYRGKGIGSAMTSYWEDTISSQGHTECLLSTLANETSQVFYRRRGYKDIGGFVLEGEPMEIIMTKKLTGTLTSDNL